ncbi:DUF2382 domain-containing protein [Leptolyngbya sp. FACHB-261]|uniref:DUF2382 domain-containing protein n=1 Tax=Leptolyngbya sp. FACHB-261 TaxID=2692806 RepID=UPI001F553437|nr:DUF2382 domain-containing protein [Leptolyngbya sp. FACHB-261]
MFSQTPSRSPRTRKHEANILALLAKLRQKLHNFAVLDRQGRLVGEVRDLTLDTDRRLNLIVSQPDQHQGSRLFLIASRLIQNVESSTRALSVNMSQEDIQNLPPYSRLDALKAERLELPRIPIQLAREAVEQVSTQPPAQSAAPEATNLETATLRIASPETASPEIARSEIGNLKTVSFKTGATANSTSVLGASTVRAEARNSETKNVTEITPAADTTVVAAAQEINEPRSPESQLPEPVIQATLLETPATSALEATDAAVPVIEPLTAEAPKPKSEIVSEEIVRLLEERLVVNSKKRKLGEVVVRKQIEVQMVQVPVRREKLIVEQISPEHKQLATVDLGEDGIPDLTLAELNNSEEANSETHNSVIGEFLSPKAASLLLDAIAHRSDHGCGRVRVELIIDDPELKRTYQEWFDTCSAPGKRV